MNHLVRATRILCVLALAGAAIGCGDDDQGEVPDSGVADAHPAPDALVCEGPEGIAECDGVCVDTSSDPMNCGGCAMACDSPGQICSGALPCACPEPFLPATIMPSGFDQVQTQGGTTVAVAPLIGDIINALVVGYNADTPIGIGIDLSTTTPPPFVLAGYDIDPDAQTAHTVYAAVAGRLRFKTACDVGASGTLRNATFIEVNPDTGMPVDGGCTMTMSLITFAIGEPCP